MRSSLCCIQNSYAFSHNTSTIAGPSYYGILFFVDYSTYASDVTVLMGIMWHCSSADTEDLCENFYMASWPFPHPAAIFRESAASTKIEPRMLSENLTVLQLSTVCTINKKMHFHFLIQIRIIFCHNLLSLPSPPPSMGFASELVDFDVILTNLSSA